MSTRTALCIAIGITLATLAYSLWVYPALPAQIPIHWDINGRIDGWGAKEWAAFFGPGLSALLAGLLLGVLPWLSPRQFAVEAFRGTYNYVVVLACVLVAYIHLITLQSGLHAEVDLSRALVGGLFVFFALLGNVLGRTRRNFWMGVRTPWTLASDRVWTATHRLAGRLMVAGGVVGAVMVLLGAPLAAAFVVLMVSLLWPVVYSLVLYKRLEREGGFEG
jgi:uncharacterized membrane protein